VVSCAFGFGFQIETAPAEKGLRSVGSLSWGGIFNTHFWIDPQRQIAAVVLMQTLPYYDDEALKVLRGFEREVYRQVSDDVLAAVAQPFRAARRYGIGGPQRLRRMKMPVSDRSNSSARVSASSTVRIISGDRPVCVTKSFAVIVSPGLKVSKMSFRRSHPVSHFSTSVIMSPPMPLRFPQLPCLRRPNGDSASYARLLGVAMVT